MKHVLSNNLNKFREIIRKIQATYQPFPDQTWNIKEGEIFDIVSDFFSVWPLDGDRGGVNSHLNSILTQIEGSIENPSEVLKLVAEGKQLIKKRQKLIKIADRVGLWLKSTSPTISRLIHAEDEKKLRKAKSAVESKRKDVKGIGINALKKFKFGSDSQLFRGKIPYCFTLWSLALVGFLEQPTIKLLWLCLSSAEGENS